MTSKCSIAIGHDETLVELIKLSFFFTGMSLTRAQPGLSFV